MSAQDQEELLRQGAQSSGRRVDMLEKDVWVLECLKQLFALEGSAANIKGLKNNVVPSMAFKGGTSLSKAFGAIRRFSEDVDVALDQQAIITGKAVYAEKQPSNSVLIAHQSAEMKIVNELLEQVIAPGLRQSMLGISNLGEVQIVVEVEKDGSKVILVKYPSLLEPSGALLESVKLEIGGRNPTDPTHQKNLRTDLETMLNLDNVTFPQATVTVLAAERTFWEKVTAIHSECHREASQVDFKSVQRKSRHWSDLADLARGSIGESALAQRDLLKTVVEHKSRFYKSARSNYPDCLVGKVRLIPDDQVLKFLEEDYAEMQEMFYGDVPEFQTVLDELRALESRINLEVKV